MLALYKFALPFFAVISLFSARTVASPAVSGAEILERQTDTTSYTNSKIIFTELPLSDQYPADYALYSELASSTDSSSIESSIQNTITDSLPQYFDLLGEDGLSVLYGVGNSGGVYTSLYCERIVDGMDQELEDWYGYVETHLGDYAASMTSGFMSELSNTNTIEACGILLDENGNVMIVLLIAMAWGGQEGYVFGSGEASNKLDACYNAW